eukprot:CAMPEP_0113496394 /NCGR_PEP_ID=MMETSP0014_2-20120614/30099_1 /TAXON_ID=2857 /ORGANISM="Nitzschia sp." /LENGTH=317 /DNA_ID=CAMNT_0000390315 /DNA_START=110 /DNA_END=1063 /DNA_ORIENTATION=+ /assembly_acc=CAM_ASM_000159
MTSSTTPTRATLTGAENLAVGAVGGCLEVCVQMPILTYKFCLQEGRAVPRSISGLYRGVGVQASTVAPITAIQFLFNGMLQESILKARSSGTSRSQQLHSANQLSDAETIMAAAGAGAMSAIVYSPVDLLTIQQQKLGLDSVRKTVQTLVQSYGLRGLYRGFWSCVGREALYTAGYLGLAPVFTSRLVQDVPGLQERPLAASIIGACTAGTLAAITTHPIDTAKTCLQSDMQGATWTTTFGTIGKLTKDGGVSSLYRGMIPRTVRLCGAFFICLMVRDAAVGWKTRNNAEAYEIFDNGNVADTAGIIVATAPRNNEQ